VLTDSVYRASRCGRSGRRLVTVIDAVMACRWRSSWPRWPRAAGQPLLVAAILMPLWRPIWSSVRLAQHVRRRRPDRLDGLPVRAGLARYGLAATVCTLAYLWFPYMVLRSSRPGAVFCRLVTGGQRRSRRRPGRTLRTVVFPAGVPALVAGRSSLLVVAGDYVAVKIVGGTKQFLGNLVYDTSRANNQPLAAAVGLVRWWSWSSTCSSPGAPAH